MKKFEDYIKEISKEEIIKYYIEENHTWLKALEHFNISNTMFARVCRYFEIKKPKDLCTEQVKKSKLERYGDANYNNRDKSKQTCLEKYGVDNVLQQEDIKKQSIETKIKKYGSINHIEKMNETRIKNAGSLEESYKRQQEKRVQTCLEKYGVDNVSKSQIIKDKISTTSQSFWDNVSQEEKEEIALKISNANKGREAWNKGKILGKLDIKVKEERLKKEYATKKKNNSFNTSKPEVIYYEYLLTKFNKDDILTQYSNDKRYPFNCDFYIKSLDLFIELNLHWTHGGHPFNKENEEDLNKLHSWEEEAETSKFYQNAIYTWTTRDVNKIDCVKRNNLNFKVYYNLLEALNDEI